MPNKKIKPFHRLRPQLQAAFRAAQAKPGEVVIVAEGITPEEASSLCSKLRAARKGLQEFELPDSDLFGMGNARVLHFHSIYDRTQPHLRTVTITYDGPVKPPSDMNRVELLRALGYPAELASS